MGAALKLPDAWTNPPLRYHPEQWKYWTCMDLRIAARAGRGSGKTTIGCRRLVRNLPLKTWHGEPGKYCYVGPTREQAKRTVWGKLKALCDPAWLIKEPSETELIIRSIWGSEIHVLGFDRPKRIEGVQWDEAIVDESSDIRPKAVELSLIPALTVRRGRLIRIGIPKRTGIGAIEFKRICEDPSLGYTYFHWSAEDLLTDEQIEQAKKDLSEKDYEEQIKGLSVDAGNLAFSEFSNLEGGNVVLNKQTKYNKDKVIVVGSDFNVNPMAWVLCHVYDNSVYVFDELWLKNTNTRLTLDALYRKYGDHKSGFYFIGDAAGRARHSSATAASPSDYAIIKHDERFMDAGGVRVGYPKKNPRIKDRLAACNAMLCSASKERRVFINPQCTHLIDDLVSRAVNEKGEPVKAADDYSHASDAFGYVIHRLFPLGKVRLKSDDTNKTSAITLSVVR